MPSKLRHADLEPETTGDPTDDIGAEDDPKAAWDDDPPEHEPVVWLAPPCFPAALARRSYPPGGIKDSYAVLRANGASPADAAALVGTPRPRPLAKTRPNTPT